MAPLLRRLQGDLERTLRTNTVRTHHAEERHMEGERPTAVAVKDATKASMDKYFIDTRHDTIVVIGPRLRAHIFGRDGLHVTSMQLEPSELERKTGKGVWMIPGPRRPGPGIPVRTACPHRGRSARSGPRSRSRSHACP